MLVSECFERLNKMQNNNNLAPALLVDLALYNEVNSGSYFYGNHVSVSPRIFFRPGGKS